ncbi:hypothetical protein GLAREA_06440 [Glarea lozoyensis ATCC 20868]|uniref:Uncharacterized protein n=1 Tax=Glarea lozoyensis (strain ATCC 20868 / MF5171) TaxID=1116229 RepID=S3D4Q8_GLAL2|nr:uncharacterized protein GLAREA_06440 [Glarea lozoyensis ATCC 20868]EPE33427.1 hypothetical protein GLAREA_06440 [Glarea lozoyensis ATCC 20868]
MSVSRTNFLSTTINLTCVLFVGGTLAQSADINRNCTAKEIQAHPGNVSYRTLNATGALDIKGLGDANIGIPLPTWTWSTGVQNIRNSEDNLTFFYQQPVWLDTHGTDLASEDLEYEMCYLTLSGYSASAQKRGQGDSGDCTKFFNQQCVDEWRKVLSDEGSRYIRSNITQNPCKSLLQLAPESCKDFQDVSRSAGSIPPENRTCPFGLGDPDYDTVFRGATLANEAAAKNDTTDFLVYDQTVTSIVPFFALAWSRSAPVQWSDARVMCLSTPNITEGSRKPSGVPSLGSRFALDPIIILGSILLYMLL